MPVTSSRSSSVFLPYAVGLVVLTIPAVSEAAIIATKKTSTPHPGVTLVEGTTRAPSSRFYATKVALCTKGVRVDATAPPTSFRTVPSWAQSVGASVAVNGDFYRPELRVAGIAVGGGKAWPLARTGVDPAVADEYYYERFGWIAFGPGFVEFTHTEHVKKNAAALGATSGYSPTKVVHTFPKGTIALVSGYPELVTEGKRVSCSNPTATTCFPDRTDMRARHPRTAMGISQNRRTFILVAVDGRSTTSAGMYGTELAELMSELGAWQAFNLDGGGSTEMWIKGEGTVNAPSDGASRAVANHWGVFNGTSAAAHCVPLPQAPDAGAGADAGDAAVDAGSTAPDASAPTDPDEPSEPDSDEPSEPDPSSDPTPMTGDGPDDSSAGEGGCAAAPARVGTETVSMSVAALVLAASLAVRARRLRRRR